MNETIDFNATLQSPAARPLVERLLLDGTESFAIPRLPREAALAAEAVALQNQLLLSVPALTVSAMSCLVDLAGENTRFVTSLFTIWAEARMEALQPRVYDEPQATDEAKAITALGERLAGVRAAPPTPTALRL